MEKLREYGMGPRLQRLLQRYWDGQRVVTKAWNYYGLPFITGVELTQGDPVSIKLFNIIADAVVRAILQEICGPQEAQHGFGWSAGEHNIYVYADDGQIAGRDPIRVQTALMKMGGMFERVGLHTNLNNINAMICTMGFIWGQQESEACEQRATGEVPTFQERNKSRVSCEKCGEKMAATSL